MKSTYYCLCILFLSFISASSGDALGLWVDGNNGNDNNPGTEEKPFKTITKSRDAIRSLKNSSGLPADGVQVIIWLGDYDFSSGPLEFTAEDSGTMKSPIIYTSYVSAVQEGRNFDKPAAAHLTAGIKINWTEHMAPVQDPAMRALLKDKDSIVQVDLRKLGITDFGEFGTGGLGTCNNNKVDFFSQSGMNMVLARYPNVNTTSGQWQWLSAGKIIDKQKSFNFDTDSTVSSKILSWKNTSTLWLHGYWSFDWADNYVKVDEVKAANKTFVISDKTPPVYGFIANARYYALNILEELDSENEYYIDRGSGILYLYESAARKLSAENQGCVSVGESVLSLDSVSYLTFFSFEIDCARSTAVTAKNVSYIEMDYFKVHDVGGSGISVYGSNNEIVAATVKNTGCSGIHLSGGDQKMLIPGNNVLRGSVVTNWANWKRTYNPALSWGGVGNNYTDNTFMRGPHSGVLGGGNNCLFENNVFDTLCYESSDSGGFYTGRSWIDRGNVIRGNTFKNIYNTEKTHLGAPSVQAIYLDDQMSGYLIENNTFINCHCGSFIGGGRRNTIRNNIYIDCELCTHVDDRGLTWQKADCSTGGQFEQQLKSVDYQKSPWSTQYPELVNILSDHPCVPVYNVIENNRCCGSKQFIDASDSDLKKWMITVQNNKIEDKC